MKPKFYETKLLQLILSKEHIMSAEKLNVIFSYFKNTSNCFLYTKKN